MAKKIFFSVDLQGVAKAIDETAQLTIELKKATQAVKDAKKAGDAGMLGKALQEQKALKTQIAATNKEINNQIREFQKVKQNVPKDSLVGLRLEYSKLTKEIDLMDKAARKSVDGLNKIKAARNLSREIGSVEAQTGRHQRNVGNYSSALTGAGSALTGGLVGGGALAVGAMAASAAIAAFKEARDIVNNYAQSLANLSAISGANESQMARLDGMAKQLGATTAFTATQVNELQLELSKLGFNVDDILDMSAAVIDLAIGLDGPANEAAALLGATLRSFGEDADQAAKYAEILGGAANLSAIDFQDLRIALPYVNTAAKQAGLSFADAAAHLAVLRDNGIRAESAGTGLRNIFITAATAGKPFNELLKEITESEDQLAAAAELFGKEGSIQAVIIANNTSAIEEMSVALDTANGELARMAEERLATLIGQVTLTESAYSGMILSIDSGNGIISRAAIGWEKLKQTMFTAVTQVNEGNHSFGSFMQVIEGIITGNGVTKLTGEARALANQLLKTGLEAQRTSELLGGENSVFGFVGESKNPNQKTIGEIYGEQQFDSKDFIDKQISELTQLQDASELGGRAWQRYGKQIDALQAKLAKFSGSKGGGKGKGAESAGQEGSVSFLQAKLSELTQELSKIAPTAKGFEAAAKSVDEFAEKLEKAKKIQEDLLAALEAKRTRPSDPLLQNLPGIGSLDLIPDSLKSSDSSLDPLSKTQKDIDARNKLMLDGQKKASDALRGQGKAENAKDIATAEELQDEKNRILNEGFDAAVQAANAIFDLQMAQAQALEDRQLKALDKEFDKRRQAAGNDKDLLLKIEQDYEKKKEAIQRASFEKQKKIQIKQAIINGALAAIQAVANTLLPFPTSLLAAVPVALLTAVNVATIKSQQYAEGGYTASDSSKLGPRDSTGRRVAGVVHEAEYVAPTSQIHRYPELFNYLEQDRRSTGRPFAAGGFTSLIPQVLSPTGSSRSDNMEAIFAKMVDNIIEGVQAGTYNGTLQAGQEKMREEERLRNAKLGATF